jgi:peroxiredoxin
MMRFLSVILITCGAMPTVWAHDDSPQEATTPRELYQALMREHQTAVRQFWATHASLKTTQSKREYFKAHFVQPGPYIPRFLKIVESAPKDQAAVDSLIWIVRNGGCHPEVNRAVEGLATKYADNKRLGEVAQWLVNPLCSSLSPSGENLFRAIIENNPDRVAKGQACMALAEYLKQESRGVRLLKEDTPQAQQMRLYYRMLGADEASIEAVRAWNPDDLSKRSEAMFGRAAKEYADVSDFLKILDSKVQAKLWENTNLGIDKPAPEIIGEDIDGRPLKLSDYRGRVVVLLFWGDWSGPSRAMYAQWRSLVNKMEGRPFSLLGINSDKDKDKLKQRIKDENINWRFWWDGGGDAGPIAGEFNVPGWPAIYILDHHGAIRHKFIGRPHDEFDIDEVIDKLTDSAIKEATSSAPTKK